MYAGHKVLVEVDDNSALIVGYLQGMTSNSLGQTKYRSYLFVSKIKHVSGVPL